MSNVMEMYDRMCDITAKAKKLEEVSGHTVDELIRMFEDGYELKAQPAYRNPNLSYGEFMDQILKVRNDTISEILDHIDKKFAHVSTDLPTITNVDWGMPKPEIEHFDESTAQIHNLQIGNLNKED